MLHLSHSLTHINCRTLWHSHTSSESFLCIGESALTDTVHHLQYSTVEHQLMDYLYKTASTILYTFKLVPAQPVLTFEISLFFSPARKHLGFTFVPTYSFQHIQSFLSSNNQHTNQPFNHPLSLCYISFPTSTVCLFCLFSCTSAESLRCNSEGMLIKSSTVHPQTRPSHTDSFRILDPLQHCCSSTMHRFLCVSPSRTHYCGFSCISAGAC